MQALTLMIARGTSSGSRSGARSTKQAALANEVRAATSTCRRSGGTVFAARTDSRDLVPGTDPPETGADDDHDGFDVCHPCTYVLTDINAASYSSPTSSDSCLSHGGLDQNIYAAGG